MMYLMPQLLPFINYYEVYLEPYSGLLHKLRGVSSNGGRDGTHVACSIDAAEAALV